MDNFIITEPIVKVYEVSQVLHCICLIFRQNCGHSTVMPPNLSFFHWKAHPKPHMLHRLWKGSGMFPERFIYMIYIFSQLWIWKFSMVPSLAPYMIGDDDTSSIGCVNDLVASTCVASAFGWGLWRVLSFSRVIAENIKPALIADYFIPHLAWRLFVIPIRINSYVLRTMNVTYQILSKRLSCYVV